MRLEMDFELLGNFLEHLALKMRLFWILKGKKEFTIFFRLSKRYFIFPPGFSFIFFTLIKKYHLDNIFKRGPLSIWKYFYFHCK